MSALVNIKGSCSSGFMMRFMLTQCNYKQGFDIDFF
jgi:hypothetical protein